MGDELPVADATDEWSGPLHVVLEKIEDSPHCAALLTIWKMARGGADSVAARSALDPIILAKAGLLPYVWMLERDASQSCFYRLIGESIRRNFNMPMRGRRLHEIYEPGVSRLVSGHCDRILSDGQVLFASGQVYRDGEAIYYGRRLLLPLRDEDGTRRFVIGTVDQSDMSRLHDRSGNPSFANDFVAFVGVESI